MISECHTLDESPRRDFEQHVVCKILRAGGLIARIRQFKEKQRELNGSSQLTLGWLNETYPAFPLRLRAVCLPNDVSDPLDLFRRFTNTAFFKAYRRWRGSEGIDDRKETVGLVFNLDGITSALHNSQAALERPARRVIRSVGTPPVTFAFEELESLLKSIGSDWATGDATTEESDNS